MRSLAGLPEVRADMTFFVLQPHEPHAIVVLLELRRLPTAGGHCNEANDSGCLYGRVVSQRRLDEPHRNHGRDRRVRDFMALAVDGAEAELSGGSGTEAIESASRKSHWQMR
jgi:hypothetical protein